MADEILVLEGQAGDPPAYKLLMLFPVASPKQAGGANVVPTPVPKAEAGTVTEPFSWLTQAERDAIDGGTSAYRIVRFRKDAGLTNPQLIARVQEMYAAQLADFEADYTVRYAHIGVRVNAS